jgi:hypothetical protein
MKTIAIYVFVFVICVGLGISVYPFIRPHVRLKPTPKTPIRNFLQIEYFFPVNFPNEFSYFWVMTERISDQKSFKQRVALGAMPFYLPMGITIEETLYLTTIPARVSQRISYRRYREGTNPPPFR